MNDVNAMNKECMERLWTNFIRIEKVVYLPSVYAWPEFSDEFSELMESYPDEFMQAFSMSDSILNEDDDVIARWLFGHGFLGFVAMIHTPVIKHGYEGCTSYSWGRYHQSLIYADSIQSLVAKAVSWAAAQHKSQ